MTKNSEAVTHMESTIGKTDQKGTSKDVLSKDSKTWTENSY